MTAPLTDEQVAEGLELANALPAHFEAFDDVSEGGKIRRLALALQERLEQEQRALVVAAKAIDGLRERLQAAEQERDRERAWKAKADFAWESQVATLQAERDEARQEAEWQQKRAIAAENRNDDLGHIHADEISTARQQARREAFEEAAKPGCYHCRAGAPIRLAPGGPSILFWHEAPGGEVVACNSSAIRALAEVER